MVDVSDPSEPTYLYEMPTPDWASDVVVDGEEEVGSGLVGQVRYLGEPFVQVGVVALEQLGDLLAPRCRLLQALHTELLDAE